MSGPEDDPADEITAEEHHRGMIESQEPRKSCFQCNADMPSFRVNPLCEECYAEESDEYDDEAEID